VCISVYLGVIVESSDNPEPASPARRTGRSRGYCLLLRTRTIHTMAQVCRWNVLYSITSIENQVRSAWNGALRTSVRKKLPCACTSVRRHATPTLK
jgi:hypothetical protein